MGLGAGGLSDHPSESQSSGVWVSLVSGTALVPHLGTCGLFPLPSSLCTLSSWHVKHMDSPSYTHTHSLIHTLPHQAPSDTHLQQHTLPDTCGVYTHTVSHGQEHSATGTQAHTAVHSHDSTQNPGAVHINTCVQSHMHTQASAPGFEVALYPAVRPQMPNSGLSHSGCRCDDVDHWEKVHVVGSSPRLRYLL